MPAYLHSLLVKELEIRASWVDKGRRYLYNVSITMGRGLEGDYFQVLRLEHVDVGGHAHSHDMKDGMGLGNEGSFLCGWRLAHLDLSTTT